MDEPEKALLLTLQAKLPQLEKLFAEVNDHWGYEDPIYRFYHQSFKVYRLQESTREIVLALADLAPGRELNPWFEEILLLGTGKVFDLQHNRAWTAFTRPIVEAFFHARYFLEMAIRAGRELKDATDPPEIMPSSWASLLCLFKLR